MTPLKPLPHYHPHQTSPSATSCGGLYQYIPQSAQKSAHLKLKCLLKICENKDIILYDLNDIRLTERI